MKFGSPLALILLMAFLYRQSRYRCMAVLLALKIPLASAKRRQQGKVGTLLIQQYFSKQKNSTIIV
jgi:hypothetical protein